MQTVSKHRTPSQCREWERQRRLKFNQAIAQLGDIVKNINKECNIDCDLNKEGDNVKFPKIEIVQKAILCLTKFIEEKTQLKTEILALQVKLEGCQKSVRKDASIQAHVKYDYKDASTQVQIEVHKKNKNGKIVKLLMMKKSKENAPVKIKELGKPKLNYEKTAIQRIQPKPNTTLQNLPKLLPLSQENTIVVLPAAPYIFPQRPLLFPSVPPAIVLVDPNLQTLNKPVPIISRNNGDITKTTMVNILPISAYSRPLSAKHKKNNVKLKNDTSKRPIKKSKPSEKVKVPIKANENQPTSEEKGHKKDECNIPQAVDKNSTKVASDSLKPTDVTKPTINKTEPSKPDNNNVKQNSSNTSNVKKDTDLALKTNQDNKLVKEKSQTANLPKNTNSETTPKIAITPTTQSTDCVKTNENNNKINKFVPEKLVVQEDKDRENKLPNILDTALCDSAVDGGNARLELAEEFLAASPTAAFLMSFPLVSGNRADSPAEEPPTNTPNHKDTSQRRTDLLPQQPSSNIPYYEKSNTAETKMKIGKPVVSTAESKQNEHHKFGDNIPKSTHPKISSATTVSGGTQENPFLNLPMPSIISTSCTLSDTAFGLDFDCNLNKPTTNQSPYVSNSNIFYKNDPFSTVKSTIYSTSSITNNHEFNSLGLYPCAMEKYTSKNKPEYTNMDDNNVMKIGSSRLTYDIDLGWSHKGFDFVNCTTTGTTFNKDNILTTVSSTTPFCTSYNPFNPEFHVPLNSNKKDIVTTKSNTSFTDTITSFYSQSASLWTEEPFYTNPNVSKTITAKHQTYLPLDNNHPTNAKLSSNKQYGVKENPEANIETNIKPNNSLNQQMNEKYTKKSPSKMHINWMTSEIRPMQSNYNTAHIETKEPHKPTYNHLEQTKRIDHNEANSYFPISMHNFTSQTAQEEFQVWPSTRPLGTTEISIEPPPINLPTLVGDLALGPHEKKKTTDITNRPLPPQDLQNCNNFFSVTQLMNRSNDHVASRYPPQPETTKSMPIKQNSSLYINDNNRKAMTSRVESHLPQPYVFNDPKLSHSYENMTQFSQSKTKSNSKVDKNPKPHKNNYSAEALLRGGSCSQKLQDNKFLMPSQRYNDFNTTQDTSVAQVSHFPPIIDYGDNSYTGQQFSGTSLYNTTTNTLSNSFYSNFMPGSSNLMSANYPSGPFTGEFIDYNQSAECNYNNHKYEELKMRNNPPVFQTDKVPPNYKSSRRDSAAKHKLECSKKDTNKKYQSKRSKLNNEIEEWNDPSHALWQNKGSSKRHPNLMTEEIPFPNYVGNQMSSQYQADFFNSHLMPSNMQAVPHNVDRSLASFPITSRANFNLSTIFPEIAMVSSSNITIK